MSGPSKRDLERKVDTLTQQLDDVHKNYADLIKDKTLYAQDRGTLLFELGGSYPALADLVAWLYKAHHAASALPQKSGDGGRTSDTHHVGDPAGNRAVSGSGDTSRLTVIDRKLGDVAEWIRDHMGDRGPLPDRLDEKAPVCNNPDCPSNGWPQPWDAEVCVSCADPFGVHRPRPRRFDQEAPVVKPCWRRGCAMRGRIRSCEHSI